jgi:hypothetical protein
MVIVVIMVIMVIIVIRYQPRRTSQPVSERRHRHQDIRHSARGSAGFGTGTSRVQLVHCVALQPAVLFFESYMALASRSTCSAQN